MTTTMAAHHSSARHQQHAALPRAAAAALLGACAALGGACNGGGTFSDAGAFTDAQVSYAVGLPGDGWRRVTLPTANVAWHHEALAATLMVNSHCEGVGDSPLEGLTNDLLIGTTERELVTQQRLPWSRREAMESTAIAKVDGVTRKMTLFVMKKDGCVYDIVLDSAPERHDASRAAYLRVRDGFDVKPRRDRG